MSNQLHQEYKELAYHLLRLEIPFPIRARLFDFIEDELRFQVRAGWGNYYVTDISVQPKNNIVNDEMYDTLHQAITAALTLEIEKGNNDH